MKTWMLATAAVLVAAPALAADDPAQMRLTARALACITGAAADIERAEPNLAAAVDVLVSDLCAEEIGVSERYRANSRILGLLKAQAKPGVSLASPSATPPSAAQLKKNEAQDEKLRALDAVRVNPDSGEIEGLPKQQEVLGDIWGLVRGIFPGPVPAQYRAAAARALLAARQARQH
jgi:hypothetical protein